MTLCYCHSFIHIGRAICLEPVICCSEEWRFSVHFWPTLDDLGKNPDIDDMRQNLNVRIESTETLTEQLDSPCCDNLHIPQPIYQDDGSILQKPYLVSLTTYKTRDMLFEVVISTHGIPFMYRITPISK